MVFVGINSHPSSAHAQSQLHLSLFFVSKNILPVLCFVLLNLGPDLHPGFSRRESYVVCSVCVFIIKAFV